ncbi:MAG: family 10 glycosylhydrolase [Oscillatoriales cyanobacterium C42_A2020_001]|nr:family 10 glycosylhydrolase [Leptolyngbyaceae cyanobacterium C42_A2020_001]
MVASARFSDVQTHWARPFIEGLAQRNIIRGFPDGTFRPEQGVTRAEFSVMLQTAFPRTGSRPYVPFVDVPANFWAISAIRWAYETGFLSGFPGQQFRPNEQIPRAHTLVSLVGGLGFTTSETVSLPNVYEDAAQIPAWASSAIATATANQIVVNYPALRRLRPTQPTTRAEVSAFVYQCLMALNQAPAIASPYIVQWSPVQTVQVSHRREFRAAWITSVWNKDWPSKAGLSSQQQQAEFIRILEQLQASNFNALILQVRPEGDALYQSSSDPWSNWLTGTQGQAPNPLYDPLAFAIAECHKRNIELHAWFNPYRARTSRNTVNVRPHIAATNPDVVYEWGTQLWMDPGAKIVQDRTYTVIMDVVRRYDVDGIHLDDYFYPYPIAGQSFPDSKTYQAYRNNGGTLSLGDWRRENVNQLIQRLANGIRAAKPHVKFGISPFGIYRPGQPPQIQGLDAYEQLYADALKWLQQGWVDYLAPQLYWRIDPPAQSYPVLLNWWASNNPKQRHLYIGNNIAQLDGKAWELAEIERQIEITRQVTAPEVLGNIFFSMNTILENREGVSDRFRTVTYRTPTLAPVIPWLTAPVLSPPTGVRSASGTLSWNPATAEVRSWTLYRQSGNQWLLERILPATVQTLAVSPGTYALCAVNRLAQESRGVVARV